MTASKREYNRAYYAANRERNLAASRRWAREHPEEVRAYHRRKTYGITPEVYRDLLVGQAGRCLVCGRVPDHEMVIDHDHQSGRIRGLLCRTCNGMLGFARDNPVNLRQAADYLERGGF